MMITSHSKKRAQESLFKESQLSFKEDFRILEDLDMKRAAARVVDFFLVRNDLDPSDYKVGIQNVELESYAANSAWYDGVANGLILGAEDSYSIRVNLTNGNIWTVTLLETKTSQTSPGPSYVESPVRNIVEKYRKKQYLPDKPPKPFRKKPSLRTPEILGRPRLKRTAKDRPYLVHVPDYDAFTVIAPSPLKALSKYLYSLLAAAREGSGETAIHHEDIVYTPEELPRLLKKLKTRGIQNYVTQTYSTIPYVLGLSFAQAKKKIEEVGLIVKELAHETLLGMGNVIEQIPYSDKDVPKGSQVQIRLGSLHFNLLYLKKLSLDLSRSCGSKKN